MGVDVMVKLARNSDGTMLTDPSGQPYPTWPALGRSDPRHRWRHLGSEGPNMAGVDGGNRRPPGWARRAGTAWPVRTRESAGTKSQGPRRGIAQARLAGPVEQDQGREIRRPRGRRGFVPVPLRARGAGDGAHR